MYHYFWSHVNVTAFDVGFDVLVESWSIVLSNDQLLSFFDSGVTSQEVIVVLANHLCINDFKYV